MYLFLSLIPLAIHLLLMPVWIAGYGKPEADSMFITRLTMYEALFSFITVFYLIVINVFNLKKIKIRSFLPNYVLMMVVVFLGPLIHYLNWGISTGHLLKPDPETVGIFQFQIIVYFVIVSIAGIIMKLSISGKKA